MKKNAFTMSEVLITLSVIGIVAALTIPNLIQNYKKVEYSARLKKFYSSMQQAIQMSEIDHGSWQNWNFVPYVADASKPSGHADQEGDLKYAHDWMLKYILPYMKYNKIVEPTYTSSSDSYTRPIIYFSDGSTLAVFLGNCIDMQYDVNGDQKPNTRAIDIYSFTFCFANSRTDGASLGFDVYLRHRTPTRDDALEKCANGSVADCTVLLKFDGWEYKDDYPYKL